MRDHAELRDLDPFALLDEESARVERHFGAVDDWERPTRCEGRTARDMLSHLAGVETYNRACLDDAVEEMFAELAGHGVTGAHQFNAWFVRRFNARPLDEVRAERQAANAVFRAAMRARGPEGVLSTTVGRYLVPFQAFHLAMEYATHADDLGARIDDVERERRTDWRARFARFAIREQAGPVEIQRRGRTNLIRLKGESALVDDAELVEASQGRLPEHGRLSTAMRAALTYLP